MKKYIFCPNCQSGNTHSLEGTSYRACENCGRIDFEQKYNNRQQGGVPVRYHEIINIKDLNKQIYGKGQYDR